MRLGLTIMLLVASGCASFEYDIVQPSDLARHIGQKSDEIFSRDAIEYRFRTVDSRLVMRMYNTTDQPMRLNGDQSVVVDENGQSHPLRTLTIATGSFGRLILPPQPPRIERVGPSIGIGFGGAYGSSSPYRRYGWDNYPYEYPQYLTVYDNDDYYWDWTHESDVRLSLVYEQGQTTIRHEFVIARRKKK